jgi:3D (Asp-Asp-Asp) domain-containing protein
MNIKKIFPKLGFGRGLLSFASILLFAFSQSSASLFNQAQFSTEENHIGHALSALSVFALPEPDLQARQQELDIWATYYHVYQTKTAEQGHSLLTPEGESFGVRLSEKDWCYGALQGTIRVEDEAQKAKVYNFASRDRQKQVDCSKYFSHLPEKIIEKIGKVRFGVAQGPFGDGVKGMILVPYRTIAVDPKYIPYGSVIYIPEARGLEIKLSNGLLLEHDGYFFAADTGSAIKQNHIDVFSGHSAKNPFSQLIRSQKKHTFRAYLVEDKSLSDNLLSIHRAQQAPLI